MGNTIEEPSRSAVRVDDFGFEFVGSGRASIISVLLSDWSVKDAPFGAPVADSFPELITDPKLAEPDPLDCDLLVSVASGASMLLVLLEPNPVAVAPSGNSVPGLLDSRAKASGPNLLGFADSDSDGVDLGSSDNVTDGVFDCSEIV